MFSKKKHPVFYLFEIPVEIFIYAIVVGLGAQLDQLLFAGRAGGETLGHGIPFFTVIIFVIATILLIVAVLASIVNFIRFTVKKYKGKKKDVTDKTK